MAGIVEHIAARMVIYPLQEAFKGHAIVQVLTRMNFIAKVDPLLIVEIEERTPAPRQFIKRLINPCRIMRRPGIKQRPRQRSGKCRMGLQA